MVSTRGVGVRGNCFRHVRESSLEQSIKSMSTLQVVGRKVVGLENPIRLDVVGFQDVTQESRDVVRSHLVHHIFKAHVKIAFMIHMKVMHNINMCVDDDEAHMSNQSFFVNFPGNNIPENLCFENELPSYQREWLKH
jgi:hypothetical protein